MKYYLISGEASGDMHGANLMKSIKANDSKAEFRFWGGDLMKNAGGIIVKHYKDLAFMGFLEVILNLGTVLSNLKLCKKDLLSFNPDVLILIDYPGFNLRIAKFARKKGIRVFYYISPKVWAWNTSRVETIKQNVEKMFVIFPFEKEFYRKFDFDVDFVGNPLIDNIKKYDAEVSSGQFLKDNDLSGKPIIALLPGSRKQEIKRVLPLLLELTDSFVEFQFVIAAAPSIEPAFYDKLLKNIKVRYIYDKTYDILQFSRAAVVTSGTATLEVALFNIPEVVCYKAGFVSFLIARSLIKVRYISLVNLILEKEAVKELIQGNFNLPKLKNELDKILNDKNYISQMKENYEELRKKLGGEDVSRRVAGLIRDYLKSENYK